MKTQQFLFQPELNGSFEEKKNTRFTQSGG